MSNIFNQKTKKPSDLEKELYKERKKNIYLTQQLQLKEMKLESLKNILSECVVAETTAEKVSVLDDIKKKLGTTMQGMVNKSINTTCVFKIACEKKNPVPITQSDDLVQKFVKKRVLAKY